eukprot:scaffold3870_cov246-Pinguiococcus_pyrenoidosus.AAC.22
MELGTPLTAYSPGYFAQNTRSKPRYLVGSELPRRLVGSSPRLCRKASGKVPVCLAPRPPRTRLQCSS